MNISDGPLEFGARQPLRPALVRGGQRVTYGELAERIAAVANQAAQAIGDDRQRPVGILLDDPADFLSAFHGVVAAGAIAAPLSGTWTPGERARALEACPPALVIADTGFAAEGVEVVRLRDIAPSPPGPLSRLRGRGGDGVLDQRPEDSLFYVGFSSGSTGASKAIARRPSAWLNSFDAMSAEFGIGSESRVAVPGSLFFSFSLIAALHALHVGAAVHLPAEPGLDGILRSLEGATDAYIVPSLLADLARRASEHAVTLPGLRQIVCAGEKLPAAVREAAARAFPGVAVTEYYGASELGFVTVMPAGEATARPGSVGRAFRGTQLAVLGEDGRNLAPGDVGLVCARNGFGFAGYWGDPEGVGRLDHHGWQTVGDMGWLDADGYLYLAGRRDSMVVLHGENVFPEAVEQVVRSLPGVAAAVVLPEPPDAPRRLVACVVAPGGADARAILAACAARLPRRAVPRRVVFLDALPLTATGKIARAELAALIGDTRSGHGR